MLKTTIPFVDLRGKTPVDLLRTYPDKAHALIRASRETWGVWSKAASVAALPFADRRSRRWLERTRNPYRHEIESMADILGAAGIPALNLSYEWGCTTGAWNTGETVTMLRTLDWPFPALGRHAMVVLQSSPAGDFYNVTWPGLSGVFTAMAPGRFSAAINQAPMRRHGLTFAGDWIRNRFLIDRESGLPPSHLLRQVLETAPDYANAREMLLRAPVAAPVIFTLAGAYPGHGCVIERLENAAEIFDLGSKGCVSTSNHFVSEFAGYGRGWHPREPDSHGRYRQCGEISPLDLAADHFQWIAAPMLNVYTRLAIVCDAAAGRLVAQGFEGPAPVTEVYTLPGARASQVPQQMVL